MTRPLGQESRSDLRLGPWLTGTAREAFNSPPDQGSEQGQHGLGDRPPRLALAGFAAGRRTRRREPRSRTQGVDSHLDVKGCLEIMTTDHQSSPPETRPDDDFRARNARALELLREWLADESDYDAELARKQEPLVPIAPLE
jgi:hypothetical protein